MAEAASDLGSDAIPSPSAVITTSLQFRDSLYSWQSMRADYLRLANMAASVDTRKNATADCILRPIMVTVSSASRTQIPAEREHDSSVIVNDFRRSLEWR
jgi:hypothetical protein